ncbi:NADH dehydrogenase [ubiquinone] 1 alpha subcomplex assembly factor 3 [Heteronotia binoei]|uniref:NADH dehydrogenase [ubiquinone] 1 alpha subcomplex assembly factor 3 n=1 Tax=Heteronotia binoei TaxID=13085 RepID=UPI0029303506|nr:NADH dehydrogenase [ubiquinone] 1 alpha subcomplex assembly factor 3 [Heteronotia binoei]
MAGSLRFLSPLLGWRFAAAAKPLYSSGQPQRGHRLTPSDDEMYQKTTIQRLESESQDIMFIESYNAWGFTINGDKVVGPCVVLPKAILQWNVGTYKDITAESLTLFRLLEPRIEIVVLGTGDKVERLDPALLKLMRQCGIAVEVQDTPNACATFNFLTSERRVAAAGLIPPPGIGQRGSVAVG